MSDLQERQPFDRSPDHSHDWSHNTNSCYYIINTTVTMVTQKTGASFLPDAPSHQTQSPTLLPVSPPCLASPETWWLAKVEEDTTPESRHTSTSLPPSLVHVAIYLPLSSGGRLLSSLYCYPLLSTITIYASL